MLRVPVPVLEAKCSNVIGERELPSLHQGLDVVFETHCRREDLRISSHRGTVSLEEVVTSSREASRCRHPSALSCARYSNLELLRSLLTVWSLLEILCPKKWYCNSYVILYSNEYSLHHTVRSWHVD